MHHNREQDRIREEFFRNYRGRYSSYWVERWGLIPELPTSFDNANSIYELLAWLQRAFKQLLDDFVALESELEDFKNAFVELLENLVPLLIRRYMASQEADNWFTEKADRYYQTVIKPYIDEQIKNLRDYVNTEIADTRNSITQLSGKLDEVTQNIANQLQGLQGQMDTLTTDVSKTKQDIAMLEKAVNTLKFMSSGQPPYTTVISEHQNSAVISLNANPSFPETQGVGLKVANVSYETDKVVNRTTWLQINLGELSFTNIKAGDVLGYVSIDKLRQAGIQESMLEGIERFTRVIAGITVDLRPIELLLSKEGDNVKISYLGGFLQASGEGISGGPRTENSSPWIQISETAK